MRIIIAGSRNVPEDLTIIQEAVKESLFNISVIISGGARGIDKLGEEYAIINNIPLEIFPANWDLYGKSAGYIRNKKMANNAEGLIAIWDGISKGTEHMINIAKELNLKYYIHRIDIISSKNSINVTNLFE